MVPPARGTALSLLLLLAPSHSVFLILHSSPHLSLSFFLSSIYTIFFPAGEGRKNIFYQSEKMVDQVHESAAIDNDLTRTESFFLSSIPLSLSQRSDLCMRVSEDLLKDLPLVDVTR